MHWRNSQFQVAHFLAGKCHTADGAYRMLRELREERDVAVKNSAAIRLRAEAKRMRANEKIVQGSPADVLEARADIVEIEAFADQSKAVYDEAIREIAFLDLLITNIQPHRKYAHLKEHEAHQAAQREEWKLEMIHRAETFLFTTGSIPQDHFSMMMSHPDFKNDIVPAIEKMEAASRKGVMNLSLIADSPVVPLLIGNGADK